MRKTFEWGQELRQALRDSEDLQEYVNLNLSEADFLLKRRERIRFAQLVTEVELGLTLLREIAPEESAISVSALLWGYRFPIEPLRSQENWLLVQKARFYLIRRKGRQWERSLTEYINLPETIRIYGLTNNEEIPQLIPSSVYPRRLREIYLPTLQKTPPHQIQTPKLATAGLWYAKISQRGHFPIEVPVEIPEAIADITATKPEVPLERLRTSGNPAYTVTREELLRDAQEMDEQLSRAGYEPENYHQRLSGIAFRLYDETIDDFCSGQALTLEQLVHIVGLLNVGKSTLLQVLTYHFAKKKLRCALIVNDVVSAVRLASLFWEGIGIPAVPILGNNRPEQLEKVYEPILMADGQEICQGATHFAWRWFSPICPLLALVQAKDKWEYGSEPCHSLYQKVAEVENDEPDDVYEDWEDRETNRRTCPFYYHCPRHQLEKDTAQALVWILTPASFILSLTPRQVFPERIRFAEAVYRECHFLFVDEADRVQVQFDEEFSPDEVLLDNSENAFLNRLGLDLATIYNSNRSSLSASLLAAWKRASDYAQITTDLICHQLYNHPKLEEWLGYDAFTGRSLFARIVRRLETPEEAEIQETYFTQRSGRTRAQRSQERRQAILTGLVSTEQRQRQQRRLETLEGFLQAPLDRRRGGELSEIALTLLSTESEAAVLSEIEQWWQDWLKEYQIETLGSEEWEKLKRNTYFAILISVLDDRLSFLVDYLPAISRVIDLHDLSKRLVYRPPLDYLPVVPSAPVGNILGFRYLRDCVTQRGGKLEYFRYVGVGRALLLDFPTLFAVDNWKGPHTVLISGTSYAPGSPAYHIKEKPTVLLEPARNNRQAGDAGIAKSKFFFKPQLNGLNEGKYIALSGLLSSARREASGKLVKAICYTSGQAQSLLEKIFQDIEQNAETNPQWWRDRSRVLIIVGGYSEAEWVDSQLNIYCRQFSNSEAIVPLHRDNNRRTVRGIQRGKIQGLRDTSARILTAPLGALERGHNILNQDSKAAFGAGIFLNRPMPVPDDWQATVQQLNAWALDNAESVDLYEILSELNEPITLTKVEDCFYRQAVIKMLELNDRAWSFYQLNEQERRVICWTELVKIWQIIGRLIRGGVPCFIYFLDVKFAPHSALGKRDSERTSLLLGIIKELEAAENGLNRPYQKTLARSLYGAFLNALQQMRDNNLNYD